jgi:hypothetical protein
MSAILDDFFTRTALTAELGVCERTLIRWKDCGSGPPITKVGARPLYRKAAVAAWLAVREQVLS